MFIDVPYFYKQDYLPTKRHKIPRYRILESEIRVEIPEIKEGEKFPTAFVVHDYFSVYDGNTWDEYLKNRTENDHSGDYRMMDIEIRTYNGKLYQARRFNYGSAIGTGFCPVEDVVTDMRRFAKNTVSNDFRMPEYSEREQFSEKSIALLDDRENRISCIRKKADDFLIFNGKIWEECSEPMYVVMTFGLGHNHGGTGMFIEYDYNSNISAKNYFNALQRIEAIAYANMIAEKRGDTNDIGKFGKTEDITVLMPEMVSRNPIKDHPNCGDPFLEKLESIIEGSDDVLTAGIGVMAAAFLSLR